jgi:hypothetical protein
LEAAIDRARESLLVAAAALGEADGIRRQLADETRLDASAAFYARGISFFVDLRRVLQGTVELTRMRRMEKKI